MTPAYECVLYQLAYCGGVGGRGILPAKPSTKGCRTRFVTSRSVGERRRSHAIPVLQFVTPRAPMPELVMTLAPRNRATEAPAVTPRSSRRRTILSENSGPSPENGDADLVAICEPVRNWNSHFEPTTTSTSQAGRSFTVLPVLGGVADVLFHGALRPGKRVSSAITMHADRHRQRVCVTKARCPALRTTTRCTSSTVSNKK